jgi:hypothetical protein
MSFENTSLMSQASPLVRAVMQKANERTAIYFTASIVGLFLIIFTGYFLGAVLTSFNQNGRVSTRSFVMTARYIHTILALDLPDWQFRFFRSKLLRKVPLFPTLGHGLVFTIYIAINITLLLQNLDLSQSKNWAKRMGW